MPEGTNIDQPPEGERVGQDAPDAHGVREIPEDPGSTPQTGTPPLRDDQAGGEVTPGLPDDVGAPPHETSGEGLQPEREGEDIAPPPQD
jgi:hypothetical protein